jgi:hypothetical protein
MGSINYLKNTFYYSVSSPSELRWRNQRTFGFDNSNVNAEENEYTTKFVIL